MNPNETKIRELLGKYLNNTLSAEESVLLDEWYASFDAASDIPAAFADPREEAAVHNTMLKNIHHHIQPAKKTGRRIMLKIAAAAVLVGIVATSLVYFLVKPAAKNNLVAEMNVVVVPEGRMKLVELTDGSKIWLNAATKFSYPKQFSATTREVTLIEGEAFFDVAHETDRPFIVHSKGLSTRVLGTSFNIDAYSFSKCVKISVATGKVGVSKDKEIIGFLTPNEELQYKLLVDKSVKTTGNGDIASSWRTGKIVLDYVDFESLKAILFNNYNYTLKAGKGKPNLNHLRFSATLKKTDHIEDVMKLLSAINKTRYSISDSIITMY
ncbi:FecR family protein [Chitinophaga arvensicola]|uniref:Ferric-dicitrate binding protein FerR, regulates iron transport through sigma-19 n=1 Tax=Chitinophaga arvensicola TaxID=29529 RepID=A0A1I0SA95_9BACT|nr:FecR family protein [Chitinophaga arvensicola]SEW53331.1 ferric-dicitrate binding protein FerR, regulates iron transport through sigma-19 [Chitinophaga arvensicola]